jgi:predicted metal-dependent HD superfamily phosphohydrolase
VTVHEVELRASWQTHVAARAGPLDRLLARHREAHRHYHGIAHVAWVVRHVGELAAETTPEDLDAIVAAAFYHDAVYDPERADNEAVSAALARRDLEALGWSGARADAVAQMIEATAGHRDPPDLDTAILLDADLAVLGADPAGYGEYARGVRAEYHHLDEASWRRGRAAVLHGFLDRDAIYATGAGRRRWEERARGNISAELATLS